MTQTAEFLNRNCDDQLPATAGGAVASCEIVKQGDGRAGYYPNLAAAASGDRIAYLIDGIGDVKKAAGTGVVFAVGQDVVWDASANTAIQPSLALDGSADFVVGPAIEAAVTGDDHVSAQLNGPDRWLKAGRRFVFEFDTETDVAEHVLIPAEWNPHGLLFLGAIAIVTEVFAGAGQDQGIVTIEDEDDNVLGTITPADAGADAAGDILYSTNGVIGPSPLASGGVAKVVAAGKAVQGQVTQQTSGAGAAGKMKVYVLAIPLL